MGGTAIFWPMIGHAALVFAIYSLLSIRRVEAVRRGDVKVSEFRENRNEPPRSLFVRNNLANQFELPILFHAACLALFATGGAGILAVVTAWVFTLSRVAHSWIHVTSNRIRYRRPAFAVGFLAVAVLWVLLAVQVAIS